MLLGFKIINLFASSNAVIKSPLETFDLIRPSNAANLVSLNDRISYKFC